MVEVDHDFISVAHLYRISLVPNLMRLPRLTLSASSEQNMTRCSMSLFTSARCELWLEMPHKSRGKIWKNEIKYGKIWKKHVENPKVQLQMAIKWNSMRLSIASKCDLTNPRTPESFACSTSPTSGTAPPQVQIKIQLMFVISVHLRYPHIP